MKTSVKTGTFFALIWIILILSAYIGGRSVDFFLISELLSLLLLLGAIFAGLFLTKKENNYEKGNALEDFKVAMQSGLVYTVIITGFVYIYHSQIDPSIKESFIQERITALHEQYPDEASYKELQAIDNKWREKGFDDFIENQEDQTRTFIGSFFTTFFHLMILFMFSLFYSFFVTIVLRKVILRE
ncbi:DUF4199 domain-containing protein [Crocinitomix sp.]|nr:DUF4199 domain-containing protein [Crocinitomix sp.]